ncbi:MAG: hypothetical protein RL112_2185 [Planctomycetota bacterium]
MRYLRFLPLVGAASGVLTGVLYLNHNQATAVEVIPALIPMPLNLVAEARGTFIEGPLMDYDLVARVIVVNGTQVQVPSTVLIDTTGDGVGDITLAQLVNPALCTPIGGTVHATANLQSTQSGHAQFIADTLYFEFGERVVVGPLVAVDAANDMFQVGGHQIRMSADPRLSPILADLGGHPITVADLVGFEGSLVSAEGYVDEGVFYGKFVETQALVPGANVDGVGVERALWDAAKRQIDVRGTITAHPTTGQLAPTVQIDLSCDGLGLVTANVVPGVVPTQGDFVWRSAEGQVPVNPGSLCVRSANGGATQRGVDVK